MANGTDLIKQAALIELGDYACFFRFRDRVKPYFNKVPYNKAEVIKKINEYVRRFSKPKGKIDQEKAVKILIAEDLKRIKKIILKKKFQKPDDLLEKQIKQIKRIFRKYKLAKDLPEPHLVSKFPKPFQKMDWNCCFCGRMP